MGSIILQAMPYPMTASGPVGDLKTASVGFAAPGNTTPISVTHADLAGITPKAALVLGSRNSLSGVSANSGMTFGGVQIQGRFGEQKALGFCSGSQNNLASTNVQRFQGYSCYYTVDYGITIFNTASPTLVPGGVDLSFTTPSAGFKGSVLLFGGDDIDAVSYWRDLGDVSAVQNVELALAPDAIITMGNGANIIQGRASFHTLSFGFATKDGQQRCLLQTEGDNLAAGSPTAAILTDACAGQLSSATGDLNYKVFASAFNSAGFSLQSNSGAGDDSIGYIALNLGGRRCKIVDFVSPTSTGVLSVTGAGFKPGTAIIVGSNLESVDPTFPLTTNSQMSNFMISTVTAANQHCHAMKIASGADPTSTHCWSPEKAIAILNSAGAASVTANLDAFTEDGMDLIFDAVAATGKRFFALLIEEGPDA